MGGRTWTELPHPVAFVLSGGASLGAIQAGMVQALAEVGLEPDLVVGTSVGALNGAVIAESATLRDAGDRLEAIWRQVSRRQIFPGGRLAQAWSVLRAGYLHPNGGVRRLIVESLDSRTFEDLLRPLLVVASATLTAHSALFDRGDLVLALLATTALPGVFPPVEVDGTLYWDGGTVATVPLRPAISRGAQSLVVLDAGDVCHLTAPPRGIPEALLHAASTAMRQRVLLEAPLLAERIPLAYLPRPCVENWSPLDVDRSAALIAPTRELAGEFLRTTSPPVAGSMAGLPHHHTPHVDHAPSVPGR